MKRTTKRARLVKQAKHKGRNAHALIRHNARAAFLRDKQEATEARREMAEAVPVS
jgi:hypothetical protein